MLINRILQRLFSKALEIWQQQVEEDLTGGDEFHVVVDEIAIGKKSPMVLDIWFFNILSLGCRSESQQMALPGSAPSFILFFNVV